MYKDRKNLYSSIFSTLRTNPCLLMKGNYIIKQEQSPSIGAVFMTCTTEESSAMLQLFRIYTVIRPVEI